MYLVGVIQEKTDGSITDNEAVDQHLMDIFRDLGVYATLDNPLDISAMPGIIHIYVPEQNLTDFNSAMGLPDIMQAADVYWDRGPDGNVLKVASLPESASTEGEDSGAADAGDSSATQEPSGSTQVVQSDVAQQSVTQDVVLDAASKWGRYAKYTAFGVGLAGVLYIWWRWSRRGKGE